jgi:hypothetical protein
MTVSTKRLVKQTIAMIVVAAMLQRVGLSPILIGFFFVAGFLLWIVLARSKRQEAREIFTFYVAADEILRDEERGWYGFEIWEVVRQGERVLEWLPDPPPLVYFSLGALQYRLGDYESAIENLTAVVNTGLTEEYRRLAPSPALRSYVQLLRNIEREPAIAPLALAAVRRLELSKRTSASVLLADSRERLQLSSDGLEHDGRIESGAVPACSVTAGLHEVTSPRPINEVLHDIYQDEEVH